MRDDTTRYLLCVSMRLWDLYIEFQDKNLHHTSGINYQADRTQDALSVRGCCCSGKFGLKRFHYGRVLVCNKQVRLSDFVLLVAQMIWERVLVEVK